MANKWSPTELKRLEKAQAERKPWETDYVLAGKLASTINKSPEAIRWQLRQYHRVASVEPPKILLLDIETLPLEGKFWSPWNVNIQPKMLKKDWSIVCWSAKWLFDRNVMGGVVSGKEAFNRKDESVLGGIWSLMNEADITITHNGDDFDIKKLNTRFLIAGMPPPMYYKSIDTLSVLKKHFAFTYNKMDEVNKTLGIGRKIETGWEWWDECSEGNEEYINKMLVYNKQDVHVLEELYLRVRPWIQGHPNLNLHSVGDMHVCPNCSGGDLHWKGKYASSVGLYRAFRCESCGAIGRSTLKKFKMGVSEVQ